MWSVWLWMRSLAHVRAARAGVFSVMLPVAVAAVGVLMRVERIGALHQGAEGLAVTGLLMATWPRRGR